MARKARILVKEGAAGVYHICSRTAGAIGTYPLEDKENRYQLLKYIKHYASLYQCEVYGFVIMGNHYHLILRFFKPKKLSKSFLQQKALQFYPKSASLIGLWGDEKWAVFEKRLFSLAEFMRSLNRAFTNWFNARNNSRGSFWADRFKSTVLGSARAIRECMLYVDLNPVRAGLVEHPEDFEASSCHLRLLGKDEWLVDINQLMEHKERKESLKHYRQLLYERGALPSKEGQIAIPVETKKKMQKRDYRPRGIYRKHFKYFVNGVIIGSKLQIEEKLQELRSEAARYYYKRRKHAMPSDSGDFYLQHQRVKL